MKGIAKTVKRRRSEQKTDYKARFNLLKSGRNRVIIRKTNQYVIVQVVSSTIAQDKVICGVSSKDLITEGWPEKKKGSLKSRGAAYLTGMLLEREAASAGVTEAIIDLGMHRNIKKGRIYAVVKGMIDNGMKVPFNPEALPSDKELEFNANTRELLIKLKETLKAHGRKGNSK